MMTDVVAFRPNTTALNQAEPMSYADRLSPSRKLDFEQWARDVATCHFRRNPDCRVPYTYFMSDSHPYWIKAFIKNVKPQDAYNACELSCDEIKTMYAATNCHKEVVVRGKS